MTSHSPQASETLVEGTATETSASAISQRLSDMVSLRARNSSVSYASPPSYQGRRKVETADRLNHGGQEGRKKGSTSLPAWRLQRVTEFMRARRDRRLDMNELAAVSHLSRSHFCRSFKASMGLSPSRWHLKVRIDHACTLLEKTNSPLVDVALNTGFADQSHLTRQFIRIMGTTPGAWRRDRTHCTIETESTLICQDAVRNLIAALHIRIRRDPLLGPAYAATIGHADESWTAYLASATDAFWSITSASKRNFRVNSAGHPKLDRTLFDRWKALYVTTCQDLFEPPLATALQRRVPTYSEQQVDQG